VVFPADGPGNTLDVPTVEWWPTLLVVHDVKGRGFGFHRQPDTMHRARLGRHGLIALPLRDDVTT
jgi:hypothetical protein